MTKNTYVIGLTVPLALLGYVASLVFGILTGGRPPNFGMIFCLSYVVLIVAYLIVREICVTLTKE